MYASKPKSILLDCDPTRGRPWQYRIKGEDGSILYTSMWYETKNGCDQGADVMFTIITEGYLAELEKNHAV